jgi:hypothetical protein
MRTTTSFLKITLLAVWLIGCTETQEVGEDDLGYNYTPLKVGLYWIYAVNGVEYINSEDSMVFSYQMKESVIDSFQNLENEISYQLLIEKKDSGSIEWYSEKVCTVRKDNIRYVRTEGNLPVIHFVFPLRDSKTWDSNGLNGHEPDQFQMTNLNEPYNTEFNSYNETVTVIQEDIPDYIDQFVSKKEIYSKSAGLIFKENIILDFKQGDFLGEEIVDSGIRYFQSLVEHGEE